MGECRNERELQARTWLILRVAPPGTGSMPATLFTATDEIVFRDAVKSAASKQCYKAVASMHDAFSRVVEHVQTIENSSATNSELQAKVAELTARNTVEAIERVTADLKIMKAENAKLAEAKAASAG